MSMRMAPGPWAVALFVALGALFAASPAALAAMPQIHAHRGGPLHTVAGKQVPQYGENTLPAFAAAADAGYVLELDVKLTRDRVPIVIHDDTLDRTTTCRGLVARRLAAGIRSRCEVDILGTDGNWLRLPPGDPRRTVVPTLAEVLELAKEERARLNLEVKNLPTDSDFDSSVPPAYAKTIADAIRASRFPPGRLIVQSFWPPNLDVFEAARYFNRAQTSLLTLRDPPAPFNHFGPGFALLRGYEWVSPQWPPDATSLTNSAFVAEAHALGRRVVPWTLDTPAAVISAARARADAVISNDPGMARDTLD